MRTVLILTLFLLSSPLLSQHVSGTGEKEAVELSGAVKYPGRYVLDVNGLRVVDLIDRAGGFAENADPASAIIRRILPEERLFKALVAIDVAEEKLCREHLIEVPARHMSHRYRIPMEMEEVVQEGDILYIPLKENFVRISGAVNYPNVVLYDGKFSFDTYVRKAGGFSAGADKDAVRIVLINGMELERGDRNFRVRPGCEIVVPYLQERDYNRVAAEDVVRVAAATGSVTEMVIELINLLVR